VKTKTGETSMINGMTRTTAILIDIIMYMGGALFYLYLIYTFGSWIYDKIDLWRSRPCPKHSKYMGVRSPKIDCKQCRRVYKYNVRKHQ
jgi:hypothetical protein